MRRQLSLEGAATPATVPPAAAAGRQFSLAGLLGFVTWLAVILALAVGRFSNYTMLAVGFSLAGWNGRGEMAAWQAPPARRRVRRGAWLLLLLSMFLPAVRGCSDLTIAGWQAAGGTFVGQVARLTDASPGDTPVRLASDYLLITLLNLGNILAVICPFVPARGFAHKKGSGALAASEPRDISTVQSSRPLFMSKAPGRVEDRGGRYLVGLFGCCATATWCLPLGEQSGTLLVGYYVWCGAMLCLLMTVPLRRRELAAMAAVAAGRWITLC